MISRFSTMFCAVAATVVAALPAAAQDTVKIAYVDPLSGGGASIGEVGLKTFQYLADVTNAHGGIAGHKLEIVAYDNKLNAQETLVQVQKAIDSGIRFITQGNGSAFAAAIEDFVAKYNERNPGKEVLFFNYAAVDPVLTNDKCSYWHFRWDANSDIKMTALTNYMKTRAEHQEGLFDQSGLFVRPVGARRGAQDAQRQTAGHRDRRRRGASLAQGHRLLALYRQDQGLRRRQRHHRQLGPGFRLADQGRGRRRIAGRLVHLLRRRHRRPDRDQAGQSAGSRVCDRRRRGERAVCTGAGVREGVPRQDRRDAVLSARRQRDPHVRQGRRRSEFGRADQGRGQARRHEGHRLRRRRGLHALRRSSVLPADVHRQLRPDRQGPAVRRGEHRLGLEDDGQDRHARTPSVPPAAR